MRYTLMNKNQEVMRFELKQEMLGESYLDDVVLGVLPVGFKTIQSWLINRKASKHNEHLRRLMVMCNCEKTERFIQVTHAASINDTFWVKSENEDISWSQVSLYHNEFNEMVSKLAFEGIGLYGMEFSSTSPELSTDGSFRKCWRREDGEIYLYKRGQSGARNEGLEPYGEVMASELAVKICGNAVSYDLKRIHGELASRCKLFTDEEYGYVPFSRFHLSSNPDEMLRFYGELGAEDEFRRMLVLDAITFNIDRHTGNHGVLVENDTQIPVRMAPVFDLNLALLPYVEDEEFAFIGDKLLGYAPKIGDDFTRIGQLALTSNIRSTLVSLKGFEFSFRGDDRYTEKRVRKMEETINRQIDAILKNNVLFTKDVFVLSTPEEQKPMVKVTDCEENAQKIGERLMETGLFASYMINLCEEECEVVLVLKSEQAVEIHLNPSTGMIIAERDGIEIDTHEDMVNEVCRTAAMIMDGMA